MFDDKELGAKILGTPSMSQYLFIKEMSDRTNGKISIADPNNGFCTLSEFSSSLHAQFIRQENKRFNALYPKRAETPEDLFPFLSDYDYTSLTASPCEVPIQILFNKDWIIENAVNYNDTYNAIFISKESIVTISGVPFTLYYTLMIFVNKATNIISVEYDINTQDKLKTMSTNLPRLLTERTIGGITYLVIVIDVYQFVRQLYTETVDSSTGFYNSYSYTDKFYAAKVEWWSRSSEKWVEMSYSLSEKIYDTNNPTAILMFDNDSQTVSVRIPQIYFTNKLVGNTVRTTIFSTKGKMDLTISESDMTNVDVDFVPNSTPYSAPLAREKDGFISTYNVTRITGGADPIDFQTFRKRVIDQTIYDQVPISNLQIDAAVSKYGFKLSKHLDNLTDNRIFYAGSTLSNASNKTLIPVVVSKVIYSEPYNCSTIVEQSDGTMTILPTTLFRYDRLSDTSKPLTDSQITELSQKTESDYVDILNKNIYTRQPYHVWLNKNSQYPTAKSYNLMQPKMTSLMLQRENNRSAVMINVISVNIEHLNDGTGGYRLYIYTERSKSLGQEAINQCKLIIQANSRNGTVLTYEASYTTTDSNGFDIYTFDLNTTYRLYEDGYIQISSRTYDGSIGTTDINLTSNWTLKTLISRSYAPDISDDDILNNGVPKDYLNNYGVMSHQEMILQLGEDLKDLIFNQVSTTWGPQEYQTYDNDIPYTYNKDVYMTDRKGNLLSRFVTGDDNQQHLSMVKLFSKGDQVLSGQETSYKILNDVDAGDISLTLQSTEGLLIGQIISGTNIGSGTMVSSINGNQITLSTPVMNHLPKGSTIIASSTYIDTVTTQASTKGSSTLTVGNTENILPNMNVHGFGIDDGTLVSSCKDGVITLNKPIVDDVQTSDTIVIFYIGGSKTLKHKKGDTILDGKGNPITVGNRNNIYGVEMVQFDARLYESQDPNDQNFVKSLPSVISDTAHSLDPIRDQLIERTYLYYRPFRTLGDAVYGAGDNRKITMSLEMSYNITYYVSEATKSNTTVLSVITSSTMDTINDYVQRGKISTNSLGYQLKSQFSSLVTDIDISGVDNTDIKTITIDTQGASPTIERKLSINSAGQKVLVPNVNIVYQTSPT